jgi:hypothetical protein
MAPNVPASPGLYATAQLLGIKGRFARAAEKLGGAADEAAKELAVEDCLVVAFLRAVQAGVLLCHTLAPTVTVAEVDEARQTVKAVLLPQLVSTVTRRKAAGTLLPGSCRAAEEAWFRAALEAKTLQEGMPVEVGHAVAKAFASHLGFETFMHTAKVALEVLLFDPISMSREMQLSHAAFIVSAFEVMAHPQALPSVVVNGICKGVLPSVPERILAQIVPIRLLDKHSVSSLDREALSLMVAAWRRVERSGAIAMRMLGVEHDPSSSIAAGFDAAAAEAAVRGLRECALAGCASKEVHVSQFKRCAACQQAFYRCREHQLADWPAHKAACKAARKAATPSSK